MFKIFKSTRIINLATLLIFLFQGALAQSDKALQSITADELKGHIYFLASDFMGGRVGPSAEYEIAAQYVAAQFGAAGLEPVITEEDGSSSFFQGVPFAKTVFGDELSWKIYKDGSSTELEHIKDFKILFASNLINDNTELVYVGFGIEEPDYKWNDFEELDTEGKILLVIGGAPVIDGEPVLPQEIHKKYTGMQGLQGKIGGLFNKGAAGIIIVDVDGSAGLPYAMIPSSFGKEKYIYKGAEQNEESRSIPSIYLAKPEVFEILMAGNKSNPLTNKENLINNYKPQLLKDIYLDSNIEVVSEEMITTKNVIGMVRGTDPVLKDEYIVVGAHLDHVNPVMGQVCNGADDNASGSSGVIEIAEAVALNPFKRSVIFVAYTAEEMGLHGSEYFVHSKAVPLDKLKFNLNMDMIGRSGPENEETRAHYVVTNKKYIAGIEAFINDINKGVTDFPLIFDNDEDSPGGSDHMSYINEGIPAFFFFSGMHSDLHQPGDDADKIDYEKAESIARLSYLITKKLANMETVPGFVQ